jgi:hypothetical protein
VSALRFSGGSATRQKADDLQAADRTSGEEGDMSFVTDFRYEG